MKMLQVFSYSQAVQGLSQRSLSLIPREVPPERDPFKRLLDYFVGVTPPLKPWIVLYLRAALAVNL